MFSRIIALLSLPGFVIALFKVHEYMWTPEPMLAVVCWGSIVYFILDQIETIFGNQK